MQSPRHTVVDQVHEMLLEAIVNGELRAGETLHDSAWATRLEISRTPIREAIKRMEGHGIVDIAAARFTKIVAFTNDQARQEARDWAAIHVALVKACDVSADGTLIADLEVLHAQARDAEAKHHEAVFAFFERLRGAAKCFTLQLGATAAAYRFRLAIPCLRATTDADLALCADLITALQHRSNQALTKAFDRWTRTVTQSCAGGSHIILAK
jgi:DNA-binding GntR family transcriptional regulator